ncbi:hypothetical protein BKA67DRAFT_696426 [Truncatella angustata]|uniref:Uncharacterized protein n=1 Tax=Truncatella angustata TaxID=152316 RepID=A0A9P8UBT9_9PEZI|nr:uncharacterized protein BKA67DRAFT_696426 [Truncatella angustata]KAH6645335.1 hypothetical protein BKA67DRAFT_696426 [Truncatella angustata]
MLKNIATFVILAAAFVKGFPVVDNTAVELGARDVEVNTRDAFVSEERDIEARALVNLTGFADFEAIDTSGLGINEIGYYGGLFWRGIAAVSAGNGGLLAAIRPRSPTNVGAFGALTRLLNGRAFITSRFFGSRTQSFGISSFFFGCNGAALTLPVSCRIAVAGYDSLDRLVAYQTFTFNPTDTVISNMQPAILRSSFSSGLTTIRLATDYDGLNVLGSTSFDNIRYTIIQDNSATLAPTGRPINPIDPTVPALTVNPTLII